MVQAIEKRARFDIIRYSNCWEDANILLQALDVREGDVCFSIASSGDNTLSLLTRNPSLVLAVDLSPAQLACLEIRKSAFAQLPYEEVLRFLGIRNGSDRVRVYRSLRGDLSESARAFWDAHLGFIKKGVIHVGRFEKMFHAFRKRILPLIHGRKRISMLLKEKSYPARAHFYDNEWNTWHWRMLFKIFFSRAVIGRLGRDPEFFRYVERNVADHLLRRSRHALTVLPTDRNPYLEYILTGNFQRTLPFYLREENYEVIRGNLDKLLLYEGNVEQALQAHSRLRFDRFNLSDIFEYMSQRESASQIRRIAASSREDGRLAYWNMLVDRRSPESLRNHCTPLDELARKLFSQDKAFFYKSLIIEEVK